MHRCLYTVTASTTYSPQIRILALTRIMDLSFKTNAHKTTIQQYDGSHFKNREGRQKGSLSLSAKLEVTNAADT